VIGLHSVKLDRYDHCELYTRHRQHCDYDPIKKKADIGSDFLERIKIDDVDLRPALYDDAVELAKRCPLRIKCGAGFRLETLASQKKSRARSPARKLCRPLISPKIWI
jgi:hypothetical protein